MTATEQWIDVDGGRLYVESSGTGNALLLIHGWSLDHRSFAPQVEVLSSEFRVVCYDRRGFGRSDAPPDMHRELDDIDRLLDALSIPSAHVVGVSQGGRIALRYAATRPVRIRSLVLQGAMVDGLDIRDTGADAIPLDTYIGLARAGRLDELRARWLAHPMMKLASDDPQAASLIERIVSDYTARDLVDFDTAAYAFDIDPLAAPGALSVPILLVTGEHETEARKAHARAIRQKAADSRELIVADSGHLANVEQSRVFNDAVLEFCGAADSRAGLSRQAADRVCEGGEPA